jgi:hypothetical protein
MQTTPTTAQPAVTASVLEGDKLTVTLLSKTYDFTAHDVGTNWNGVSFSPTKRGQSAIKDLHYELNDRLVWLVNEPLGKDRLDPEYSPQATYDRIATKIIDNYKAYWYAKSRTMSSMITGPARFPVASNRKKMDTEHRRLNELLHYINKSAPKFVKRQAFPHGAPGDAISADAPDAMARIKTKLAEQKAEHEGYLQYNKEARKNKTETLPTYVLTNSRARVKGTEERLAKLEKLANATQKETVYQTPDGEVKVAEEPEDNRIRLYFPDKPCDDTRQLLKKRGFRWSPRAGAWQRQLTDNARRATRYLMSELKERTT